jgi:hypothetical protein
MINDFTTIRSTILKSTPFTPTPCQVGGKIHCGLRIKEINEGVRAARVGEALPLPLPLRSSFFLFLRNNKIKYQFVELEHDLLLVGRLIFYCRR